MLSVVSLILMAAGFVYSAFFSLNFLWLMVAGIAVGMIITFFKQN